MRPLGTIIVGIDFSEASASALAQAVRIAAFGQAVVRPVHVVETFVVIDVNAPLVPMVAEATDELVKSARERWTKFIAGIPGAEKLTLEVEVNSTVAALARRAEQEHAGLLTMGVEGVIKARGAGPVASACVRAAPTDVLLVQQSHGGPFTTVVVGVDFSPTAKRALEQAVRFATQDGAGLHIVHAYKSPWGHKLSKPDREVPQMEAALREGLLMQLRNFVSSLGHELGYLKPVYSLADGDTAAHGIAEYAKRVGADLVIMGKRGQTNLRDLLLGSTAERFLRTAPCSVLAVQPA